MKSARSLAAAAVIVTGMGWTATASATDLYVDMESTPVAMADDGFDWQGFYAGVYGAVEFYGSDTPVGAGKLVGFNLLVTDNVLFGVEGRWAAFFESGAAYWEAFGNARAGVLLTDDVLLYATGGVGVYQSFGGGGSPWIGAFGGGIEFAATDDVSVRAEVQRRSCINAVCSAPWTYVMAGAFWHLN